MTTKGDVLRFQLGYALSGVRLQYGKRFMKLGLTEEERYAAAQQAVDSLRKLGGWRWLDEPMELVHQWDRDNQHRKTPLD